MTATAGVWLIHFVQQRILLACLVVFYLAAALVAESAAQNDLYAGVDLASHSTSEILETFKRHGVVRLRGAAPAAWLSTLRTVSIDAHKQFFTEVKKVVRLIGKLPEGMGNSNNLLCFSDVTQRAPGKVEIKLSALEQGSLANELQAVRTGLAASAGNNPWGPIITGLLGKNAGIENLSFFLSHHHSPFREPAQDQEWHSDTSWFPGNESCQSCIATEGTWAVVVYIVLSDINHDDGGAPEYIPGTHIQVDDWKAALRGENREEFPARTVPLQAGDVIIYDTRTVHRGRARKLKKGHRPVLKVDYFREGLKDVDNPFCPQQGALLPGSPEELWLSRRSARKQDEL